MAACSADDARGATPEAGVTQSGAPEEQQARGVHNPRVVDLVTEDAATGEVVLVMLEQRPWGSDPDQLRQLEDKFNSYLGYVLDGHMAAQYPQYAGKSVRFQIDCASNPRPEDRPFLAAMSNFAAAEQIRVVVAVMQAEAPV
jgi:Family of unknown function (DUF6572)